MVVRGADFEQPVFKSHLLHVVLKVENSLLFPSNPQHLDCQAQS